MRKVVSSSSSVAYTWDEIDGLVQKARARRYLRVLFAVLRLPLVRHF